MAKAAAAMDPQRRARSIRIALAHVAVVLLIYLAFIAKQALFGGG
jgi:hypothetical protein